MFVRRLGARGQAGAVRPSVRLTTIKVLPLSPWFFVLFLGFFLRQRDNPFAFQKSVGHFWVAADARCRHGWCRTFWELSVPCTFPPPRAALYTHNTCVCSHTYRSGAASGNNVLPLKIPCLCVFVCDSFHIIVRDVDAAARNMCIKSSLAPAAASHVSVRTTHTHTHTLWSRSSSPSIENAKTGGPGIENVVTVAVTNFCLSQSLGSQSVNGNKQYPAADPPSMHHDREDRGGGDRNR